MIQIESIAESGAEAAIRGMRNPMNSWAYSDTFYKLDEKEGIIAEIGENDRDLMLRLVAAGPEHRKFMRMMVVTMDVIAPLYWWKEYETYKVGVTCNSCSTMHKIHAKEFTWDDFSTEHLLRVRDCALCDIAPMLVMDSIIKALNFYRRKFLQTSDKVYWWQLIQLLPSSYNQKRTVCMNYEVLRNIYWQRWDHKLDEWRAFCETMLDELKYPELITAGRQ